MRRTNSGMAQPEHSIFFNRLAGVLAIALMISLALAPRLALSADEIVEEVVVTGSYIKRSVQEQPNPVDLFDRSE